MYGRNSLKWLKPKKGNQSLWYGDNYVLAVVPDETYPKMFWVVWPDGRRSWNFYNITWAKENAMVLTLLEMNNGTEEAD